MEKFRRSRFLIAAVLALMVFMSVNCGYILYPWRRGNPPGDIDGGTLVMDILWFIPGIVPGAIALAIDFSTGSIYLGRGRKERRGRIRIRHTTIRIDSLSVHPGDRLGLCLNLAAPPAINSDVMVTLAPGANGGDTAVIFDTRYAKADEPKNMVVLTVPADLRPGEYRMSVAVNGVESNTVDLKVTL
ncbi:MAG: hypothetical protein M1491_06430 [Deltaproteobacteria bacterium]|nr:hypothetical protein [Deltaproteobacteria bacterium]MCL5277068.1 hypothetical protein [Deltaproteobacteria bacterium]